MRKLLGAALMAAALPSFAIEIPVVPTGLQSYRVAGFSEIDGTFHIDLALPVSLSAVDEYGRPQFQFNLWIDNLQLQSTAQGLRMRPAGTPGDDGWQPLPMQAKGLAVGFALPVVGSYTLETYEYGFTELRYVGGKDGVAYSVEVTPIPEPATWALMLLGLLGIHAGSRRRWTA